MNTILRILGIASVVLLLCTILCGLWVKFHPEGNDMNFHFLLSISSVCVSLLTIVLFMFQYEF